MQCSRLIVLLVGGLLAVGCAHIPSGEQQVPPRDRDSVRAAAEMHGADRVYRAGLEKYFGNWNERIDVLMSSVELQLEKLEQVLMADLSADEQRSSSQRRRLLLAYQKKLEGIKQSQEQLSLEGDLRARESLYVDLITRYITCLRIERKLREDAEIFAAKKDALKEIRVQYRSNDYDGVVYSFDQLSAGLPSGVPDAEARIYYALSLSALNRTDEAVAVCEALVKDGVTVKCANAGFLYEIGEILIDAESYRSAERVFNALIVFFRQEEVLYDKARKKAALFQSDLDYLRVRNKLDQAVDLFDRGGGFSGSFRLCQEALRICPDQQCRREIYGLVEQFVVKTAAEMDRALKRVDMLIEGGKLLEAYELIASFDHNFPDDDYPSLIMERLALMKQRQARVQEKEINWKEKLEQEKFDKAIKLLRSEQYPEAIRFFEQLEGTQYEAEARQQKASAVDFLARSSRIKAGQLALQANQTVDPDLKKTYLIESYTILKKVMDNYPDNQYADRIAQNLEVVRSEIEKISPRFFTDEE